VQATKDRFGRIDFLVNVACSYLDNGAASTRAEWLESLDVNLVGSVMLMQAAEAELAKNRGAIVNFGSISSRVAQTGRWLYPVSKAAILQLTRNQAMDLAPKGIRVNAVSPGWTWSNIMDQLTDGNRAKTDSVAAPFHLLGRVAQPRRGRLGRAVPVLG
jgi:NAD(P)-dependent dehydrogenase (short-subunit alcohol dehydrogenase family)